MPFITERTSTEMFLLTEVTWYSNGRQSLYSLAVADNVPALQTWVADNQRDVEWVPEDELGLIRTKPWITPGGAQVLFSISLIDRVN